MKRNRDSFSVCYIDYGNKEDIKKLCALSPQLLQKRCFLVSCKKPSSLSVSDFTKFLVSSEDVTVLKIGKNFADLSFILGNESHIMQCHPCFPNDAMKSEVSGKSYEITNNIHKKAAIINPKEKAATLSPKEKATNLSLKEKATTLSPKEKAAKIMVDKILSVNTKYNVKVVFIKTFSEIFVQFSDEEKSMNDMLVQFNKYCTNNQKRYEPHLGEIVGCRYIDGVWYRGLIKEIVKEKDTEKYRIFFIDFGNEELASSSDIQFLPDKFSHPKFCLCVSVPGVKSEIVSQCLLKKLLSEFWDMKIININKQPMQVTLMQGDTTLSDLVKNKSALKRQKLPESATVIKISYEDEKYLYIHMLKDIPALEELSLKLNSLSNAPVAKNPLVNNVYCGLCSDGLWYRVVILEQIPQEISLYKVCFLDYGNCETITKNNLRELPDDLFTLPIYCLPITVDNRNKLSLNMKDQYTVEVVGMKGKIQEVKFLNLKTNPSLPNISSLERRCLKDGLNDVMLCFVENNIHYCQLTADNDEIINLLNTIRKCAREDDCPDALSVGDVVCAQSSDGSWYRAAVISTKNTSSYKVLFFDYGNTELVKAECIKVLPHELLKYPIFAIPLKIRNIEAVELGDIYISVKKIDVLKDNIHVVDIIIEKDATLPVISCIERTVIPIGTVTEITICHIEDIYFAHPSFNGNKLTELSNSLLKAEDFKELLQLPKENDVICAKFSDGVWYRSFVSEVHSTSNSVKVHFFDYGNSEIITLENIRVLPSELCSYPILCVQIKFKNPDKVNNILLQNVTTLNVKVLSMDGDVHVVDLQDSDDSEKSLKNVLLVLKYQELPINEECQVIFYHREKDIFYLQNVANIHLLSEVQEAIKEHSFQVDADQHSYQPSVGELVCAMSSVDNCWYRGYVKEILSKEYKIFFIDYGNCEVVPELHLKCMPSSLIKYPALAIQVKFKNPETAEVVELERLYTVKAEGNSSDNLQTIRLVEAKVTFLNIFFFF